jgi:hypothetical protein
VLLDKDTPEWHSLLTGLMALDDVDSIRIFSIALLFQDKQKSLRVIHWLKVCTTNMGIPTCGMPTSTYF